MICLHAIILKGRAAKTLSQYLERITDPKQTQMLSQLNLSNTLSYTQNDKATDTGFRAAILPRLMGNYTDKMIQLQKSCTKCYSSLALRHQETISSQCHSLSHWFCASLSSAMENFNII